MPLTIQNLPTSVATSYPVSLFPVRVETRFDLNNVGAELLKIRIYPDEIFADTHEPLLTAGELAAGQQYWNTFWNATDDGQRKGAWRQLVAYAKAPRAAWIAKQTQPTNLGTDGLPPTPHVDPAFPTPGATRSGTWTRAPLAPLLPDRWTILAYRGGAEIWRVQTKTISKPLALATSPSPSGTSKVAYQLELDSDALWTVDYDAAVTKGMAVTVSRTTDTTADWPKLSADDISLGFDRLIVVGVKTDNTAENDIANLLDAHHYTDGLAIVPQGTPTNNTHLAPSAYPPPDPNAELSYAVERGGSLLKTAGCDGNRLASALGIRTSAFEHVLAADRDDLTPAKAMGAALWPGTLGYFIEQMMAPVFTLAQVHDVRRYFLANVQARGQLPAFRAGRVPYGVLPVTSLYDFVSTATSNFDKGLAAGLASLMPIWLTAVETSGSLPGARYGATAAPPPPSTFPNPVVPRVRPDSSDPEGDLIKVLAREASSTAARIQRGIVGPTVMRNFARFFHQSYAFDSANSQGDKAYYDARRPTANETWDIGVNNKFKALFDNWVLTIQNFIQGTNPPAGLPWSNQWSLLKQLGKTASPSDWTKARIVWSNAGIYQWHTGPWIFNATLVSDIASETETLSTTNPAINSLGYNYIKWLRTARVADVRDRANFPAGAWIGETAGSGSTNSVVVGGKTSVSLNQYAGWSLRVGNDCRRIVSNTASPNPQYTVDAAFATAPASGISFTVYNEPKALLYEVLRRATLELYLRLASLYSNDTILFDGELLKVGDGSSVYERLDSKPAGLPAGFNTLGDYLASSSFDITGTTAKQDRDDFLSGLQALEPLPTAELERLFTETLDLFSCRLDAWVSSLANVRLAELRTTKTTGSYLGGYAFVENLRPIPRTSRNRATNVPDVDKDGNPIQVTIEHAPKGTGGFLQAPSLAHAAAGALLNNIYVSHGGSGLYRIDLPSYKVRDAQWMLASVRAGQPLGAVLGYLFERWLQEFETLAVGAGVSLTQYIYPLRKRYPLVTTNPSVTTKGAEIPSEQASESIDARNVLDGLRLLNMTSGGGAAGSDFEAWRTTDAASGGPAAGDAEALKTVYARLSDAVKGLADLLTAEAVYQTVKGNPASTVATLEGMAQGLRPPDPDFVRTPTEGISITHRVGLIVTDTGCSALTISANWPVKPTGTPSPGDWLGSPRSDAEPYLDAWMGSLLGDPALTRCRVSVPGITTPVLITLQNLKLRPIDFVALTKAASSGEAETELDRRVLDAVMTKLALTSIANASITYAAPDARTPPDWDPATVRSFQEAIELGAAIDATLGKARALTPADLAAPAAAVSAGSPDGMDAVNRASAALNALKGLGLDTAIADVQAGRKTSDALRPILQQAALYGLQGAYPPPAGTVTPATKAASDLLDLAQSVQNDIAARVKDGTALGTLDGSQGADSVKAAGKLFEAVLGRGFLWLPRFTLDTAASTELDNSFKDPPSIPSPDTISYAMTNWFNGAAKVRPALRQWHKLKLYARALAAGSPQWTLAQLPYHGTRNTPAELTDVWVGAKTNDPKLRGRVSIVLQRAAGGPNAGDPWVGLQLDEWTEVIPSAKRTTGISFHYDNPGAEAPQAVLLAVPADKTKTAWDYDQLANILNETFNLSKIRAVSLLELEPILPAYLPLIYYPVNTGYIPTDDTLHAQLTDDFVLG